jgi:hypothetical protein
MKRFLIGCGVALLIASLAVVAWQVRPETHSFYTDADSIKEPVAGAVKRDVLWQPPTALADTINAGGDDYEPRMSADGLTLYFVRGKAGHNADIYCSRRTYEGWTKPQPLSDVNSDADDLGPELSADGASLYFYSDREGGRGGYDIWVSRRGGDGWQEPTNLGPAVNSEYNDYGPALTPDAGVLYFSSNRPQPQDIASPKPNAWPATLREDSYHRTYDLYSASITDHGMGEAVALSALNSPSNEGAPAVSPFGDFIYFASDRPGGVGGFDLYRSRRLRGEHLSPTNLGPAVNTVANELDPALSMGGYSLYFSSDRSTGRTSIPSEEPNTATREYNLYQTTSREVFTQADTIARAPIDWAAVWSAVGPNLMWAFLALLLLLTMWGLFKSAQNRKLSLLTKCLLASLAAHLLLMMVFNVWKVASSIAGEMAGGRKGPIQITLAGPGSGNALVTQIRGPLTGGLTYAPVKLPPPNRSGIRDEFQVAQAAVQTTVERSSISPPASIGEWSPPSDTRSDRLFVALPRPTPDFPAPPSRTLETALPDVTSPIRNAEAERPLMGLTGELPRIARSTISAPTGAGDYAAMRTAIEPVTTGAGTAFSTGRSFVERVSPNDAAPRGESGLHPPAPPPAVVPSYDTGAASSLALAVPAAVAGSATPQEDGAVGIAARASPTSARAATPCSFGTTTGTTAVSLSPVSSAALAGGSGHDSSFAGDINNAAHEAAPQSPGRVAVGPGVDVPALPAAAVALALPRLEASGAVASARNTKNAEPSSPNPPTPSLRIGSSRAPVAGPGTGFAAVPWVTMSIARQSGGSGTIERAIDLFDASSAQRDAAPARIGVGALGSPTTTELRPFSQATKLELSLPTEERPPENPYVQRFSDRRMEIVEQMGGSKDTEGAVDLALQWFSTHQSRDGHWSAADFDQGCGQCGGQTHIGADHALTGLSLLCFLGAGHTHVKAGLYRENVERGLRWLSSRQKADGDLRGEETMYSHGIATIALSEAYAMTGDRQLFEPVQRAAGFIQRARNTNVGGWRYDPGQPGDTSVLGWQVMALKSAANAGVDVSGEAFDAARAWLDRVSERSRPGLYAYQPGQRPKPSMTAEGMFAQLLLGLRPDHRRMRDSVDFILQHLPHWESDASTYFWYYASLALFQHQGKEWETWNKALTEELTKHQRKDGRAAGSWDPVDDWSKIGGRIYQTALCTLMLEVYYRYLPLYFIDPATASARPDLDGEPLPVGTIRGVVTDAATHRALAGAAVRLDLPDRTPVTAFTEPDGTYMLDAPDVPDFFALSASHKGFVPKSANVERARLEGRTVTVDFALEAVSDAVLVTEAVPDVHHLGDDHFDGAINSQFQKKSEGSEFAVEFELSPDSASAKFSRAEVRLLAKGVQRNHRVVINGTTLKKRLNHAPEDGRFGEFVAPFDAALLRPGKNSLQIIAAPSDSDIDDFEFVNVQVRLSP